MITQRSGLQTIVPVSEKEHSLHELLVKKMSTLLPFRGSLTPDHAHQEPILPQIDPSIVNSRLHGGAVNLNTIEDFTFLNTDIQKMILKDTGFSFDTVRSYLI